MKFKPGKYKLELIGYGGEYVVGNINRELFDFFRENSLVVGDFAYDSDYAEYNEIPDEILGYVSAGSWYEIDDIFHTYGATDSCSSYLAITDEDGNELLQVKLSELYKTDIDREETDEFYVEHLSEDDTIFMGIKWEKGLFFSADLEATEEFSTEDLCLLCKDIDGQVVYNGIKFKDVELDDNGEAPDTVDKGADMAFYACIDGEIERYMDESDYETED